MNLHILQRIFGTRSAARPAMPGCDLLLLRARLAIRAGELAQAEAFVLENGEGLCHDAACLNVLGLIAEARGHWTLARKYWTRSTRADKQYEPARQNLRRYFELFQFGRSRQCVAYGDEQPSAVQEQLI